ncbi:MAG: hypothetical protein C4575_13825 [Desulforudis sp.]|jgi:hypothetical protein|nr:N-formylglutamate amidohydrolase [Clostridia bacterium]MDQ7792571.1 N-formylglutamate amidohydrolase [Clostridia bacterium]RJX17155.1 MAG: hypothetical protein C4575_13825 [Desulforudis sp.]
MEQPAIDVAAALKTEELFFKPNGYRGLDAGASYTILSGSIPVLVSAPHAVKHIRKGNTEPKEEDEYTGTIARLLQESTGCWAMHAASVDLDPNFYDDCPYKHALRELVKKERIRLIIDIHGAAEWRAFNIDLGTCRGDSLLEHSEYLDDLITALRGEGIQSVFVDSVFTAGAQSTVTRFASRELGIPAVQLEINRRLRDPERNPVYFGVLMQGLHSFIRDLG